MVYYFGAHNHFDIKINFIPRSNYCSLKLSSQALDHWNLHFIRL